MSVMMLRVAVKPESVDEVEAAATSMFAAINRDQPAGVRYASCRIGESETFLIMLQVDDGSDNPLAAVPEFRTFQENVREWITAPPVPEQLTVVGSYNLF